MLLSVSLQANEISTSADPADTMRHKEIQLKFGAPLVRCHGQHNYHCQYHGHLKGLRLAGANLANN